MEHSFLYTRVPEVGRVSKNYTQVRVALYLNYITQVKANSNDPKYNEE